MTFRKIQIICFTCDWVFCDETERYLLHEQRTPFEVNVLRVPCIGRLDPATIISTFEMGADGVLFIGCIPTDCHFGDGNLYAESFVKMLKKLLKLAGLEPERLELRWSSPVQDLTFSQMLTSFAAQIQGFGSSPFTGKSADEGILLNILAAKNVATDFRLRVLSGRERQLTDEKNAYGEKIQQKEFDDVANEVIEEEFIQQKIRLLTMHRPLSVEELASIIFLKPSLVLRHIVEMRMKGRIAMDHVTDTTPFYKAVEAQ